MENILQICFWKTTVSRLSLNALNRCLCLHNDRAKALLFTVQFVKGAKRGNRANFWYCNGLKYHKAKVYTIHMIYMIAAMQYLCNVFALFTHQIIILYILLSFLPTGEKCVDIRIGAMLLCSQLPPHPIVIKLPLCTLLFWALSI